jgi:peptidoglycan/LPS O-acetylase OafA/YrhL
LLWKNSANGRLQLLPGYGLSISVAVLFTFASILMTTPAAYLSWRLIEMPFINFVKNAKRPHGVDLPVVS